MYLIDYMEKAFNYCTSKVNNREYDDDLNNMINAVVDIFLLINDKISSENDSKVQSLSVELADKLVEIAEDINNRIYENLSYLYARQAVAAFTEWKEYIRSRHKYKIIVYGITQYYFLLQKIINGDRAEIIAYSDINDDNIGKSMQGLEIIDINKIDLYEYDYLLLLGGIDDELLVHLFNAGKLHRGKIFNFCRHFLVDSDCNFYTKYYNFMDSDKKFEGFITGLSYFESGINTEFLKKRFFNFAVATQDLFFDYQLIKYALEFENFKNTLKYNIIGMPYYGFGFDLSKSRNVRTIRTEIYYPILGTIHNYENGEAFKREYEIYKSICSKVFRHDYARIIYESLKHDGLKVLEDAKRTEFDSRNLTIDERNVLIEDIKRDFNKHYPLTVKENIDIMKAYLQLLELNNIKPIILCSPVTKLYRDHASREIKYEFYNIINELKLNHTFQFIDYFESEQFSDDEFSDSSHLNYEGSKKFTNILNDIIEW